MTLLVAYLLVITAVVVLLVWASAHHRAAEQRRRDLWYLQSGMAAIDMMRGVDFENYVAAYRLVEVEAFADRAGGGEDFVDGQVEGHVWRLSAGTPPHALANEYIQYVCSPVSNSRTVARTFEP